MKNISIILIVFQYLMPNLGFACSEVLPYAQKRIETKYQTIFIGKIVDRKITRDSLGEVKSIQLKFLPLKVRKGEVSLNEYFWFPSSVEDLNFVVGESAYIYADKDKKIAFDSCYMFSSSLGKMTTSQIDKMILDWKLEKAIWSDSRTELIWAKKHIIEELAEMASKKEKKYWVEQLEIIEKRLSKVY